MNCPLCCGEKSVTSLRWPSFAVLHCQFCGFQYLDTNAANYPDNAQYIHDEPEIDAIRPELPHIQRRVRDIFRFKQPPGRALDIGCGKGEVTLALQQAGFEATGIDMKSRIMAHLRACHPEVAWRTITTNELARLSERFDLLTMYHVLEHISDPRAVLASVKALAKPGALIVVEVPNVAGLKARLKGRDWDYYKVDHVNYFRPQDLHRLAADLDLIVLATLGYQHFSWPQNVLWKDFAKGALAWLGFQDVVSVFLRVR